MQGLSRFERDFHTIVVRFQVRSRTVCYGLVRLKMTFTRLTEHLQGLHTVPQFDSIRFMYDINTAELTRRVDFMCGCILKRKRNATLSKTVVSSISSKYSASDNVIAKYRYLPWIQHQNQTAVTYGCLAAT